VRHGTVTPLTLREWNRILGNENPPVATTTELALSARTVPEGDAFTATVTVRAADGFQVGGRVRLSAPGWEEIVYLDDGVASVTVPGRAGAGERSVVAEYLGHDVLTESEDTGSILVTPRVAAPVGGEVPATLSLSLGAPVSFGTFTPGVAKEYLTSTTATVTSTAGDAALSASTVTLTNGVFRLAQPVTVTPSKTAWPGPISNDTFPIAFKQSIGASEPLRTGDYSASVTFTLSTTTP
jgi:hypothetical protein